MVFELLAKECRFLILFMGQSYKNRCLASAAGGPESRLPTTALRALHGPGTAFHISGSLSLRPSSPLFVYFVLHLS